MRTTSVSSPKGLKRALLTGAVTLGLGISGTASAVEFGDTLSGFGGTWDTTLTYGSVFRTESAESGLVCTSNGGKSRSCNYDDGTLNYDTGLVSNELSFLTEVELVYKEDWGAFARVNGFYDWEATETDRTDLKQGAKSQVEKNVRLLDAYVYGNFDLGNMPVNLRVGKQVVSWGEGTFFPSGMGSLNHFDVTKLRGAAVNLKEGLQPQSQVFVSISPTENLSVEGFYQWDWDNTEPDGRGTWFSTNDFAVRDGRFVMLGFGGFSDEGTDFTPLGGFFDPNYVHVPRTNADNPKDDGQYGLALRYFFSDFLGGTEFGLYFANYHSRLPVLSGRTGTQAGFGNAVATAQAAGLTAQGLASGLSFDAAVSQATITATGIAQQLGGDIQSSELESWATVGGNTFLGGGDVEALAGSFAQDQFAKTAQYRTEFPEDLKIYGVSFATDVFGWSWQGEYTYKKDNPLQLDDVELLFKSLSPLDGINALTGVSYDCIAAGGSNPNAQGNLGCFGQQGPAGIDSRVQGWVEKDVQQFQTTLTYLTDPMLGASVGTFVMETAFTYIDDLEDKSSGGPNGFGLRYDVAGTFVSGNAPLSAAHFGEVEPESSFADDFSWGYRLLAALQYDNLIGPWTVTPRVGWRQDVHGNTPGPGGNFIEDRKTLTLGIRGVLRNKYQMDISFTKFDGAGKQNLLRDRDFIAFSANISF
jgi:hypothetical protein